MPFVASITGDGADTVIVRLEAKGHTPHAIEFDGDRHVFTNDPAGNLYRSLGAIPVGRRKAYYQHGADALIFCLALCAYAADDA